MKKFLCWLLAGVVLFLSGCILQGVKKPASPNPNEGPSDAAASTPENLAPTVLEGMSLRDICYRGKHTFLLTDDGEVYYYGNVEQLWGAELYTSPVQGKEKLHRINLPEKAEQLVPYCAMGESGDLYVFGLGGDLPPEMNEGTASPNGELITIEHNPKNKFKALFYGDKEILALTNNGGISCIGGLTLFGNTKETDRYLKQISSISYPDFIVDVALTDHTAFIVGEHKNLYIAYRYNVGVIESGKEYPDFMEEKYPLPRHSNPFEVVQGMEGVKEIEVRYHTVEEEGEFHTFLEVFALKESGTLWRWKADQEIYNAFFPEKGGKAKYPEIRFEQVNTYGAKIETMATTPYVTTDPDTPAINYLWLKDKDGQDYLLGDMELYKDEDGEYRYREGETFMKENFDDFVLVSVVRDGLLLKKKGGSLYFLGHDHDGLFTTDNSTPYLREIKNIRWIN